MAIILEMTYVTCHMKDSHVCGLFCGYPSSYVRYVGSSYYAGCKLSISNHKVEATRLIGL